MKRCLNYILISSVACCNAIAQDNTLDPVITTATRTEISVDEAPGSVTVITKEEINTLPANNLKDVLSSVEGVRVKESKGLMDSTPLIVVRGVPKQSRTLLMLDGIPLNDSYSGGASFSSVLNPEDIEQIEIVRGPFSSLYGSNAMGGAINFITSIPKEPEFKASVGYGDAFDKGKANKDVKQTYVSGAGAVNDKLRVKLSYGATRTDGYLSDDVISSGTTAPAGTTGAIKTSTTSGATRYILGNKGYNYWESDDVKAKVQYDITDVDRLNATFMYQNYKYGYDNPETYLKNASGQSVYLPSQYSYLSGIGDFDQFIYALGYSHQFTQSKLSLNYSYLTSDGGYTTPQTGALLTGGVGTATPGTKKSHNTDLLYDIGLNDSNTLLLGTQYRLQEATSQTYNISNWKDLDSQTSIRDDVGGKSRTFAVLSDLKSDLTESVSSTIGFRYDWWKGYDGYSKDYVTPANTFDPQDSTAGSFSPKASLAWEALDGTTLKSSIGKAFHAPDVYNLYKKWNSGTTFYFPNPNLKPEKSTSYDVGVEQHVFNKGLLKIYWFHNEITDMIYSQTSTDPSLNGSTNNRRDTINAGKAETKGYEISLKQPLVHGFDVTTNYTKTFSKMLENESAPDSVGKQLTDIPRDMYSIILGYDKGKWFGSLGAEYASKVYNTDTNTDTVSGVNGSYDAYTLWNTKIGYRVTKNVDVSLAVNNLFDKEYYSYYRAQGRSWFARINTKF